MQLLTEELKKRFSEVGSQDGNDNPLIVCKFFNPTGVGTWYASEWIEEDGVFFGFVNLGDDECAEWGYFSLKELEDFRGKFGLGIERDLFFKEKRFNEI